MTDAPSPVDARQLAELHVQVKSRDPGLGTRDSEKH